MHVLPAVGHHGINLFDQLCFCVLSHAARKCYPWHNVCEMSNLDYAHNRSSSLAAHGESLVPINMFLACPTIKFGVRLFMQINQWSKHANRHTLLGKQKTENRQTPFLQIGYKVKHKCIRSVTIHVAAVLSR